LTVRRRTLLAASAGLALAAPRASHAQTPGGVLRIGMTTSDVPTTGGIPDNGSEGGRFAGYTVYDALVNWDFTDTDHFADLTPGLATAWAIDPAEHRRWIFTIRQGVTFHDGSPLTVEAILWNFDRHLNDKAPNFDHAQALTYRTYTSQVVRYEKIDDTHLALWTAEPFSMLPYLLSRVFIVSPIQYAKVGNWLAFQDAPSGTGPFKLVARTPRVSFELARNDAYWDKTRIPKVARMVLAPVPDPSTRVAALRSGQLDWIEYPAPDSIASLVAAGFQVVKKPYPHVWAWHADNADNSPLHDRRVRLALNYGIDRDAMVEFLAGTAIPARGPWPDSYKYFGTPKEHFTYDPAKSKALLAEAGYGPGKPLQLKVMLPTAGSGNMVPLPMAEFVQQGLAELGVKVEYEVADWNNVLGAMRVPADSPTAPHRDAINHGLPISDPTQLFLNFHGSAMPPNGSNWSMYRDPEVDTLMNQAFQTFEPGPRDALITQAHARIVDDAPWLFVVHDLNPRALSPRVKGFRQAQSWYQDFTQLTVS
jgi:ABC-type transport system substrate-binding protein